MNNETKRDYETPAVEVFEVCVEQGFAQSTKPVNDAFPSFGGEEERW